MTPTLRLYHFLPRTEAEGPGWRACLWVQGCSLHCPGCFNAHLWSPAGGREVEAQAVVDWILAAEGIEGVTFLGGEPFEQAEALAWIARAVRRERLSVMAFTGYTFDELEGAGHHAGELLAATDLLVDGRYERDKPDHGRPWVGSTNQRFHYLSPRYRHLRDQLESIPDRLEVRLARDGSVFINGMASAPVLASVKRAVRAATS